MLWTTSRTTTSRFRSTEPGRLCAYRLGGLRGSNDPFASRRLKLSGPLDDCCCVWWRTRPHRLGNQVMRPVSVFGPGARRQALAGPGPVRRAGSGNRLDRGGHRGDRSLGRIDRRLVGGPCGIASGLVGGPGGLAARFVLRAGLVPSSLVGDLGVLAGAVACGLGGLAGFLGGRRGGSGQTALECGVTAGRVCRVCGVAAAGVRCEGGVATSLVGVVGGLDASTIFDADRAHSVGLRS